LQQRGAKGARLVRRRIDLESGVSKKVKVKRGGRKDRGCKECEGESGITKLSEKEQDIKTKVVATCQTTENDQIWRERERE